jgi:hypothetical protein
VLLKSDWLKVSKLDLHSSNAGVCSWFTVYGNSMQMRAGMHRGMQTRVPGGSNVAVLMVMKARTR